MVSVAPQGQYLLRCKCAPRHQRACALRLLSLWGNRHHEKTLNILLGKL